MKLPVSWLRAWVDVPWNDRELADRLTMLGFEVESLAPAAPPFSGVVVAEIASAAPHPQADKLRVCKVNAGPDHAGGGELQIVCGAANARAGLRTALAVVGAQLPGDKTIGAAKLRGVESQGMLCSARELGLSEAGEGILELPADAPVGASLRDYLRLDESLLEIGITPNRGDAMSVLGIARELSAASGRPLRAAPHPDVAPARVQIDEQFPVRLMPGAGCARFGRRIIRGIDNRRAVPVWLRDRLERAGLRSISPLVDVTNYVMLELGQPMHAYDLAKLKGGLQARRAAPGEKMRLLEGSQVALEPDVLVIADESGPVGLGGVMGSAASAISGSTTDVLFEAAWFDPAVVAGRSRRYGLITDAGQRFERGVDPTGQERAIERASELICAIAGGRPGPLRIEELPEELPRRSPVPLRASQVRRLLGVAVPAAEIQARLRALGMTVESPTADGWHVTPPSWRFDITIEADLIEELARTGGLDAIPEAAPTGARIIAGSSEAHSSERSVLQLLAARGYSEAITFGFTDPALQAKICGTTDAVGVRNPIASNLAVMRASLWPGLLNAARENLRRQRERVRLFEIATQFHRATGGSVVERRMIAGIATGARLPEQWGSPRTDSDFHDLKADVVALLSLGGRAAECRYEPGASVPSLHPGRSAQIARDGRVIGQLGELHPALVQEFDFTYGPLLFELDYQAVTQNAAVRYAPVSSFPQIRRDISFTVAADETFGRIAERVSVAASTRLLELRVFDIYQGKGVESGRKSIALGLILQDLSRTLTDADADAIVAAVRAELRSSLDARIRD
ncbi:MAG: phenylalanine--tRNA ligase subunit beta [Proteobacteria bacterium]|nr:phenylalanine--tRNA ligase subunit beta [Pseudomonadota bacterium]